MKLDNLKDAQDAAEILKGDPAAIARALIEAKRDGLAEAIDQNISAGRERS